MSDRDRVEWVAVDWGTSNLRVWPMDANDHALATLTSDKGMGSLERGDFEPTLTDVLGSWLPKKPKTIVCCGMVGAAQGWQEAPYAETPCAPPTISDAIKVSANHPSLDVIILPGVKQRSPADVMRGEETQIAGYLSDNPDFDGVICLPGTHTKWAVIERGHIQSFRTFMTGELFALIAKGSILRHSVGNDGWDDAEFEMAIADGVSDPGSIAAQLFSIRAQGLIKDTSAEESRARLSGLLLGVEIQGARALWDKKKIVLIGSPQLSGHYAKALTSQGVEVSRTNGSELTLAGLRLAYQTMKEHAS